MDIEKVVVLSTAHVSEDTATKLDNNRLKITVINMKYGWFIPVDEYNLTQSKNDGFPTELHNLMHMAKDMDCQWLHLDSAGNTVSWLPTYDW